MSETGEVHSEYFPYQCQTENFDRQRNFQENLKISVGHFFVTIYNILERKK